MRRLFWFAAGFSAAAFLGCYLLPASWRLPAAGVCALAVFLGLLFQQDMRIRVALACFGLALGFAWQVGFDAIFLRRPAELYDTTTWVEAVVLEAPQSMDYGAKTTVRLSLEDAPDVKMRLIVFGDHMEDVRPGERIAFQGEIYSPKGYMDGDMDYFSSKGIFLVANVHGEVRRLGQAGPAIFYWPARAAAAVKNQIAQIFPQDTVGFMQALLLGDRTLIYGDTALDSAITTTGFSHVIAVSGMHVSYIVAFLSLLIHKRKLRAFVTIPTVLFFMAMTGFTASIVRAGVMNILVQLALLFDREADTSTSLAFSLMLILAVNPYAATGAGLQLSFAATAGLLYLSPPILRRMTTLVEKRSWYKKPLARRACFALFSSISVSLGAVALTTPIAAAHFGMVSLLAVVSSLACLWLISFVFIGGFLACLFAFLWTGLGTAVAWVVAWPVRGIVWFLLQLAKIPFGAIYMTNVYMIGWLILVYGIVLIYVFFAKGRRRLTLPICLCVVSFVAAALLTRFTFRAGQLTLTVLDVGQGQSLLLSSGTDTILIDCGGNAQDSAGEIAADALAAQGETGIDLLILTHFHADHANGVAELLERIPVSAIAMPEADREDEEGDSYREEICTLAQRHGIDLIYVETTMAVDFGEAVAYLYPPLGASDENERGLTVLCSAGDYDVLVTGDMTSTLERQLIQRYALPDIEVLIVGHHGSKYSTCDELLDVLTPETAVISVGDNNYGHPTAEVLQRLAERGIQVYRTDQSGTVTIKAA